MKVTLMDFTGKGHEDPSLYAAALLAWTKNTRLEMDPKGMDQYINDWPWEMLESHLDYIAKTIPSSWEMIHYTFLIRGVTRAFTHQLVRTRTASYAQQAMRIVDMSQGFEYYAGPSITGDAEICREYQAGMLDVKACYTKLLKMGARPEDARGILPTNILTNIVMSANLRCLVETFSKRSSGRVQSEYRDFVFQAQDRVFEVHPWTKIFFQRSKESVMVELERKLREVVPDEKDRTDIWKLMDETRR